MIDVTNGEEVCDKVNYLLITTHVRIAERNLARMNTLVRLMAKNKRGHDLTVNLLKKEIRQLLLSIDDSAADIFMGSRPIEGDHDDYAAMTADIVAEVLLLGSDKGFKFYPQFGEKLWNQIGQKLNEALLPLGVEAYRAQSETGCQNWAGIFFRKRKAEGANS